MDCKDNSFFWFMHPICLFLAFLLITQLFKRITAICSKYLFVIFSWDFAPSGRVDVCMCLGCYPKLWDFALSGRENIVSVVLVVVVVR